MRTCIDPNDSGRHLHHAPQLATFILRRPTELEFCTLAFPQFDGTTIASVCEVLRHPSLRGTRCALHPLARLFRCTYSRAGCVRPHHANKTVPCVGGQVGPPPYNPRAILCSDRVRYLPDPMCHHLDSCRTWDAVLQIANSVDCSLCAWMQSNHHNLTPALEQLSETAPTRSN